MQHMSLKGHKRKLPCQAVVNNMYMDEIPTELSSLEKLEQIRIAQRIVLEKIGVVHKGQQRKIKGVICNVPVECDQTCNQLPHQPDRSCIIIIRLKRKLQSGGQVYFEASRPELIQQVLNWLKVHNPLYKDVLTDINNIDSNLTTLQNDADDNDTHRQSTSNNVTTDSDPSLKFDARENDKLNSNGEENDDPLNEYRAPVCETCLESIIPNQTIQR